MDIDRARERFARRVVARHQRLREALFLRFAQAFLTVGYGAQLAGEAELTESYE